MSTGRCSGCGETSPSAKKITSHILSCPEYLVLYRTDQARCLNPEAEHKRYQEDTSGRDQIKAQNVRDQFLVRDRVRARQADRWRTPKDILQED